MLYQDHTAHYHLPGLFEFYELYKVFLPLYREHREWFYEWCDIGSIYGAPQECLWGGGRVGFGDASPREVVALMDEYGLKPYQIIDYKGLSGDYVMPQSYRSREHVHRKRKRRLGTS